MRNRDLMVCYQCEYHAVDGNRVICRLFGKPSHTIDHCERWPARGVGDTIAKVTTALGIAPCGGCKERQAALNEAFPYA